MMRANSQAQYSTAQHSTAQSDYYTLCCDGSVPIPNLFISAARLPHRSNAYLTNDAGGKDAQPAVSSCPAIQQILPRSSALRYPIPTKSHGEASRTTSHPNRVHRLFPAHPTPRLCQPTNLHSSAHHLERARERLREGTRECKGDEIGTQVAHRYSHVRNAVP